MSEPKIVDPPKQRRRRPRWAATDAKEHVAGEGEDRYHSRTIERALDVLEAFQMTSPSLSLRDISQKTDLPESSAFRILLTLQKRGYLSQEPDGTYVLTPRVLLGRLREGAEHFRLLARPHLEELATQLNETTSLAHLFEDYIQVLDTIETYHQIRVSNRRGRIIPPHCSAMGKSIVAHQSPEQADRMLEVYGLHKRTEHTVVDRQALKRELEMVRLEGTSTDREESMLGGICIGSPIIVPNKPVVAAISVSTPVNRMSSEQEVVTRQAVLAAAKAIAAKMQ